jgi:Protein of unknown function (DUF1592)/Protein of unknown function (DUF1588)/Protein of unknown function (DUF1587)/Protein of unknown function (DUF1585)/Protein of unknown function (DUF1595)/Planctomycete cytochrome C
MARTRGGRLDVIPSGKTGALTDGLTMTLPTASRRRGAYLLASVLAVLGSRATILAAEPNADHFAAVRKEYAATARPLVKQYCLGCHSTEKREGELDLERFATLAEVRRGTKAWIKVAEMLDNGEMPPQDAKQPAAEQRRAIRGWVERYLHAEALAHAGDPGPVVLRRLSNAEYNYTIRDLTGIDLNPTREFPTDSAAGEGFTNTGNALVMSPSLLTKYLDAGKEIARHAVLLSDGIRFSPSTTRRDWSNDALARIRALYRQHTDSGGATQVNLQGIVFDTNDGGRLPVEKYLAATLTEREALRSGAKSPAAVAKEHGLNAKYLGILWAALNRQEPQSDTERSLLLDVVRAHWREAKADGAPTLVAEIAAWQKALWRFSSVGHIGKAGGPKAWQEPVVPLVASQDVRLKLPTTPGQKEVALYLVAGDAGDWNAHDFVVWQQPRLVAPGRPDLLLRDVRDFSREMMARRERLFASTASALAAAAEATGSTDSIDVAALAKKHRVDADSLSAWLDFLGMGETAALQLDHFSNRLKGSAGYDFVNGWGSNDTPNLVANSSDAHVRIPGNMKPHGVCVHPSPSLCAAVGWRSPLAGSMRIEGQVTHAHPECGNGVVWSLELRHGATRQRLAGGTAQGSKSVKFGPIVAVAVQPGDLVSLLIGPRDGNHACDLTDLELVLTNQDGTSGDKNGASNKTGVPPRQWSLTRDVSDDVLAGNPHADRFGNQGVWHFYTEPVRASQSGPVIPVGSLLARWLAAGQPAEKQQIAMAIQGLLTNGPPADALDKNPDVVLYRQLSSPGGPLLMRAWPRVSAALHEGKAAAAEERGQFGLDPARFGKDPDGTKVDPAVDVASLCVQAPSVIEVRIPADLAAGAEFVVAAGLHPRTGAEGSVQVQVLTTRPEHDAGLLPSAVIQTNASGPWTANNHRISHATPILVNDGSAARQRFERAFDDFRQLFPAALCYTKIVPVDEVVTLTLFYREDEPLQRLMLDDAQIAQLNRLWDELHFVSHDALTLVDAFQQLLEYASQDADPKVFEPLRKPINDRAAAFRKALLDAESKHLDALIALAARAYRRPLTLAEAQELRKLYRALREEELPHDEAIRFTLARIFVAPAFLYRLEEAPQGTEQAPVSDWELASRLSYFLWSSQPDEELRAAAAAGTLHRPEVLVNQARRMLADARVRRLATEFACQWLHIYDFDALDEKSERHFPEFAQLRGDMYEESIRFFADLFQRDASILGMFNADHTFVNERLARFYGIGGVEGPAWRRVEGVGRQGRGGILGLASTLAKQSGASRTSPILRGNWVSEVLLGEKLPKPPKDVPRLPDDETATDGLTVRQLVEKHTSDVRCAACHKKFDAFGFALEGFDAIGRKRDRDLAGRPVDARTRLPDGRDIDGLAGLRDYLAQTRRDAVVRQFCRKLLGYALARGLQLSDEPLLDEMQQRLKANDYRFSVAVEAIVLSDQFRMVRGKSASLADGN